VPLTFPKIVTTWIIAFTYFEDHDLGGVLGRGKPVGEMSFVHGRADARSSPFGGCAVSGHELVPTAIMEQTLDTIKDARRKATTVGGR
jgi:hypothetical protein